jgi:DNA-binding beta-propeller fold protein YncE
MVKPALVPRLKHQDGNLRGTGNEMDDNNPVRFYAMIGKGLSGPFGIITDENNHLWVAEAAGGCVTQLDESGSKLKSFGRGEGGLLKKSGRLHQPAGVAIDKQGNFFVADIKTDRIMKYDSQGSYMNSFGDHGKGDGQFDLCWSIKSDPQGNLWVADRNNNRLQKFDLQGNFIGSIGKEQRDAGKGFHHPSDLAFDGEGNLYVIDQHNYRVLKFDPLGNFIFKFGKEGTEPGQFSDPRGITVDREGRIYITDAYLDMVLVFNAYGRFLFSFGGPIQVGGSLFRPLGITVNRNGKIFVCDNRNNRIMVFNMM